MAVGRVRRGGDRALDRRACELLEERDERIGADIVRRAVEAPMRQMATNAGGDGSIVVGWEANLAGSRRAARWQGGVRTFFRP